MTEQKKDWFSRRDGSTPARARAISVVEAVERFVIAQGPCDDAKQPDEDPYCDDPDCEYCDLCRALQASGDGPR